MRLIDADKFNKVIYHVPEDVYDAQSYIRGMEDMLDRIRQAETVLQLSDKGEELMVKSVLRDSQPW